MDAIGGYFSLEIPRYEEFHKDALRLNTGRNCLEYILRARQYKKVYIPYYTCEAVLEPFRRLAIEYSFYHIDINLEIRGTIKPASDEAILYTNYYGLKQKYVEKLVAIYGNHLIVDNTQAFYAKHFKGIDTFYTCRKFFGVPDGAYLYTDTLSDIPIERDISWNKMAHLLKRLDLSAEEGFSDFHDAENRLDNSPIMLMSNLTERIMQSINYSEVAEKRRSNYNLLHQHLKETNRLNLSLDGNTVPMVYPYWPDNSCLRSYLMKHKIYVANYWPNVKQWTIPDDFEWNIAHSMLPLPIDQRYGDAEMIALVNQIISL